MADPEELVRELASALDEATASRWQLRRAWGDQGCLCVEVGGADPALADGLVLEVRPRREGEPAYRTVGALAFSYRGHDLPRALRGPLDSTIAALAGALARTGLELPARLEPADGPAAPAHLAPEAGFPTPYQRFHLEGERPLAASLVEAFREDGHVLVRRALDPGVVLAARPLVEEALSRAWPELPPVDQRPDAYSQSFTQITDLGLDDALVRAFTHARRIARMAAALMGCSGVRLFCEDWLIKEPGARITPWHQDEAVFPFDARETVTCWIPLSPVAPEDGLLRFARGSHRVGLAPIEDISDTSEEEFARIIARHGFPIDELAPVFVGDVSFHHGRTIHGARPNRSDRPRLVLALHFFADGARIKAPSTRKMAMILENSAPGRAPGELAASERWPRVLSSEEPPAPLARPGWPRLHLRGEVLGGDARGELWVADGCVSTRPVDGAEEVAGAVVVPGLVDCHAHVSYPNDPSEPASTLGWMNARRAEHAAIGVSVLRDMGAVDDAVSQLTDVPGLPRVRASGIMILRYEEPPFTRTEPERLVRAFEERIERGASWVKVFADWSTDYRGRVNSGFSEADEVTYPLPLLSEAVEAAHARGGRVAAHCFTRAGAEVAVRAGVDSLEHGWGLDERLVDEMAERGVAWAPLVGIATNMWRIARRDGEPERAAWIESAMSSLARLLPRACSAGVTILAGTDTFPTVTLIDELRELRRLGLSSEAALAAGSWAARAWLGEPLLADGAPADLVVYRADPREDLDALLEPALVLVGGVRVEPSFGHVRPRFVGWDERASGMGPRPVGA